MSPFDSATEREIERRLARSGDDAPEPPADLLEKLVDDIPDDLGTLPAPDEPAPADERSSRRLPPRWLAAAAVLLMMVGGGFLALRLERAAPHPDRAVFETGAPAAQRSEAAAPSTDADETRSPALGSPALDPSPGGPSADDTSSTGSAVGAAPVPPPGTAQPGSAADRSDSIAQDAGSPGSFAADSLAAGSAEEASGARSSRAPAVAEELEGAPPLVDRDSNAAALRPLGGARPRAGELEKQKQPAAAPAEPRVMFMPPAPPPPPPPPLPRFDAPPRTQRRAPEPRREAAASQQNESYRRADERVESLRAEQLELERQLAEVGAERAEPRGERPAPPPRPLTTHPGTFSTGYQAEPIDSALPAEKRAQAGDEAAEQAEPEPAPRSGEVPKPVAETLRGAAPMVTRSPGATTPYVDAHGRPVEEPPIEPPPSTGGTAEPNGAPFGDVFFESAGVSPFVDAEEDALSTFGLDVDTGSYTVLRRYLRSGELPPPAAIRVEEMLNFFDYGDPPPRRGDFALAAEGGPAIFGDPERYRLLRFNVQAREVSAAERRPAVLVLVVDVSGSMRYGNRLGTVRASLHMLLDQLRPDDRIGLVAFGSSARALIEPTADRLRLREAIERLEPEGSTNAEAGLVLGYEMLARHRRPGAVHRVILCSDGVANVGSTAAEAILERVRREAELGLELTTLGFGMGNYNDVLMEKLADRGDGRYAYIDDLGQAHRVLVEELTGTLQTIASDARVQVEFDPRAVERYRLLGYENRDMPDERFRDDSADAGEIGAGHGVTALYEIKLAPHLAGEGARAHLATLRLRYRSQASGRFEEVERRVGLGDVAPTWEKSSTAFRLASTVAELAEILRHSWWAKGADLDALARRARTLAVAHPDNPDLRELADLIAAASHVAARERGERW